MFRVHSTRQIYQYNSIFIIVVIPTTQTELFRKTKSDEICPKFIALFLLPFAHADILPKDEHLIFNGPGRIVESLLYRLKSTKSNLFTVFIHTILEYAVL